MMRTPSGKKLLISVAAGTAGCAVALAAVSSAVQAAGQARDRRRFPPPGELVTVGARRLHVWCKGQGSPTVVVVPSLGATCLEWVGIQRQLVASRRVFLYDRGGLGWSEHVPGPRTIDRVTDELHEVLRAAQVPAPYVVVGHSLGGLVARLYATRHPEQTAGLVLVDSSHEEQMTRLTAKLGWREAGFKQWQHATRRRVRPLGLIRAGAFPRILKSVRLQSRHEAPADLVDAAVAVSLTSAHRRTVIREMIGFRRSTQQMRSERTRLDHLPVTVITSDLEDPNYPPDSKAAAARRRMYPVWAALQADLAGLSREGRHLLAEGSGHNIHLDDPALVVKAISSRRGSRSPRPQLQQSHCVGSVIRPQQSCRSPSTTHSSP